MPKQRLDNLKLYNKYRPHRFCEVIGQDDAIDRLRGIIKNGSYRIQRNYIFHSSIGGVGKTLLARIFSQAMNCENPVDGDVCGECDPCKRFMSGNYMDYNEFNAASWNTVDRINSIVDLASHMPYNSKGVRAIVIDEFQRVSLAAQDNMLKVLEEGVYLNSFIFCTTEFNNIKDTIRSRCFDFDVKPVSHESISGFLKKICDKEGFLYMSSDLESISLISRGCVREAVKKLEICVDPSTGRLNTNIFNYKYKSLLGMLVKAVKGDLSGVREELDRFENIQYKEDFLSVIIDLQMFGVEKPRYLQIDDIRKYGGLLKKSLPSIREACLKYNFNTSSEFFLFLMSLVDLNLISTVVDSGNGKGRRFSSTSVKNIVDNTAKLEVESIPVKVDVLSKPKEEKVLDFKPVIHYTREDIEFQMKKLGFKKVD